MNQILVVSFLSYENLRPYNDVKYSKCYPIDIKLEEFSVMDVKVFNFFGKEPMSVLSLLKKREKKGLS